MSSTHEMTHLLRGKGDMLSELKRVIDQVSREKGLDREVLIKTLEEAVKAAARKKIGRASCRERVYRSV